MSEYVWRNSFKALRSLRDTSIDDSGALYCDLVLPLDSRRKDYRRERKKSQSYIGAVESAKHSDWEDDDTSRITVQQASQREDVMQGRKMNLFSRLLKILIPHSIKSEDIEEKVDLDELNLKLDKMIATLDGENDWFVECHTILDDSNKERNE